MLSRENRDNVLRELDALQGLLERRIPKDKLYNSIGVAGLESVFERYGSIREKLIKSDPSRFGTLPKRDRPDTTTGRDPTSVPYFARAEVENLLNDVVQARTLLLGGDSADRLDSQERVRLENENLRLRNWLLMLRVLVVILPLLAGAIGYIIGGCAMLREIQRPPAAGVIRSK